ncbi:MAG: MATE family efflux transporter [Leptospira sp.]|nr:MATE family efflux transporter [Leptospira sp.]
MNPLVNRSVTNRFFLLTFLNILSNITIPLAGIMDTAILGNYSESIYIAGVSLGTVLFDYLYWGFGFLRMGTTGTTAIKTGQGDSEGVYLVLFRSLLIAVSIGSTIFILSPWIASWGFSIMAGSEELKEIGRSYFAHRIWDAPFTMMNLVLIGWFLGRSRSDLVLVLTFFSNGLNILLDIYFIKELKMSADGVGLATGLSQVFQFVLGMFLLFMISRRKEISEIMDWESIRKKLFYKSEFLQLLSFNKDIFLRTAFLIVTFSLFRNFSASMGSEILTVNTILLQFMLVFAFFVDGSAFATETLAGDLYGRKDYRELQSILRLGFIFGFLVSFVFIFLLEFFPGEIISLITRDTEIIGLVLENQWGLYPVLLFGSVAFVYDGLFLGIVKGRSLRNSMFLATFLVFIPIAIYSLQIENNLLLWHALACFMLARAITLAWVKRQMGLN